MVNSIKKHKISNFDSEKNSVQKSIKVMQIIPQYYFNFKKFSPAAAYILIQGSYETWKNQGNQGKWTIFHETQGIV